VASTFDSLKVAVSVTETTAYTTPTSTKALVIGMSLSNLTGNTIYVDVKAKGGYLANNVPIPAGSSLNPVAGKLVLNAGETVTAQSDTADSVDLIMSYLEMT